MPLTDIARIRRFNRAVTTEIGALDSSFLGRGRPLGAARVLCAVSAEGTLVADIRETLALDSGLLSRLLRSLEGEGLITSHAAPGDGRQRIACLTEAGSAEVAQYDALSDARAARLLEGHPRADALLAAMDLVASALGQHRVAITRDDPESDDARDCLHAYYSDLADRFDAGFDVAQSLDPDADSLRPPLGAFFVARSDGLPVGCVGLKGTGGTTAEIKRLWVAPAARGLRLASDLMARAEAQARAQSITLLRLDTNRALHEAIAFYRRHGWHEIAAFNTEPYAHHWFEKRL